MFCEVTASCILIKGVCQNGNQFCWNKIHAKIFDINVLLASAIVLSGNSYTKIKMLFDFMQLAIIPKSTFYSYQCQFICPTVNEYYITEYIWYMY